MTKTGSEHAAQINALMPPLLVIQPCQPGLPALSAHIASKLPGGLCGFCHGAIGLLECSHTQLFYDESCHESGWDEGGKGDMAAASAASAGPGRRLLPHAN